MKDKVLLAFTTFNQLEVTKQCMEYACDLGFDILVIDDCSTDGTQEYLSQIKVNAILKDERKGLTDSWNRAYAYWKGSDYSHLVLSNNDVLIPVGAIENMLSDYPLVVPMCNESGAGYACKDQAYPYEAIVYSGDDTETGEEERYIIEDPKNTELVQGGLWDRKEDFKLIKCWTGFCMCFSRAIIEHELHDGNLFNPKFLNVGNDDDLARRLKARLALGSYVFHLKGMSFNKQITGRNDLSRNY